VRRWHQRKAVTDNVLCGTNKPLEGDSGLAKLSSVASIGRKSGGLVGYVGVEKREASLSIPFNPYTVIDASQRVVCHRILQSISLHVRHRILRPLPLGIRSKTFMRRLANTSLVAGYIVLLSRTEWITKSSDYILLILEMHTGKARRVYSRTVKAYRTGVGDAEVSFVLSATGRSFSFSLPICM
jgi:hypothetical protein